MLGQISSFKAASYQVRQNGQNSLGFSAGGSGLVTKLLREKENLETKITQLELRNKVLAEEKQELRTENVSLKATIAEKEQIIDRFIKEIGQLSKIVNKKSE